MRSVAAAACLVLAVAALADAASWHRNRDKMVDLLRTSGLVEEGQDGLLERVQREGVPHHARLAAARSLVYLSIARLTQARAGESAEELERLETAVSAALPEARRLAHRGLREQPNSWQGAMLAGTATYLEWSLARDRRLYTEADAWEAPLLQAVRDVGSHPEPRRLLATAYLEVWNALSPAKKEQARGILKEVFEGDFRAFQALAPAWLDVGSEVEEVFSVVPDRPDAWSVIEEAFVARRQWRTVAEAHRRRLDSLERFLEASLQDAEARLQLGDLTRGRSMIVRLLIAAPPSRRFAPLVERALEVYPPGLHGLSSSSALRGWLDWSLDLERVRRSSLSPPAVFRLRDSLGKIETAVAAHAALVMRDTEQIVRFERMAGTPEFPQWAPFQIGKSRWYLEQGNVARASEDLSRVGLAGRRTLDYAQTRFEIAQALGDPVELELARRLWQGHRKRRWGAAEWRTVGDTSKVEILPAMPSEGLVLEMERVPEGGAVVEIYIDGGEHTLLAPVYRSGDRIRFRASIEDRPHLVSVSTLTGDRVVPGRIFLAE
ncbi:MAG: hypothetical protein AAGN66_18950 [Acidobacteriota bacterium]